MQSVLKGRLVETGRGACLTLAGDRIVAVEECDAAPEVWITPGLVDLQVNGFAGFDANAANPSAAEVSGMVRALWQRGVTGVCPTVCTQSEVHMVRCIEAIAAACESDPLVARSILGIHVEGPYISPEDGPRGAHPLEHIRLPDIAEYRRWQAAAGGRIRIITLSPEYEGAIAYIRAVTDDGVVASVGHTAATGTQIRAAADAGARFSTHLGNGAHAMIRRHPNYIWEQLAEDRMMAGFIFDGHHLPPSVMQTFIRAKGVERSVLVSDAIDVAGLEPGVYTSIGDQVELTADGRVNLLGTPYLAGSSACLLDCVQQAVRHARLTLADAVRLASTNPVRLLGLDGRTGRGTVRAGMAGDLTVLRFDAAAARLTVDATLVGGETVYAQRTGPSAMRS